jgi:peptide/nickel transport system ATP-binding protein
MRLIRPRSTAQPAPAVRPAGETLLEIRDLSVEFSSRDCQVRAIDGLDLTIRRGEVLALVGESGSGKSATALSIMRLLPPQAEIKSGSIRLHDEELLSLPPRKMNRVRGRRISMIFQQPKAALDPTCQVGEQVAEPQRVHCGASKRAAWERAEELIADVGIPDPKRRAHSYAHQLSGGMAQRVMIAAALDGDPELLIADEPTTALDVTVQAQILRLLQRKRRETGLSLLLITHDLGIVATVADRVAVMYAGRIVEEAPVRDIFAAPQHPYTQALVRCSLLRCDPTGRLFAIAGAAPRSGSTEQGCRYRARCPLADQLGIAHRCETEEPDLITCGAEHRSRCWAATMGSQGASAAMSGEQRP